MDICSKDSHPIVSLFCYSDSSSFGHQELISVGLHTCFSTSLYSGTTGCSLCSSCNFPCICPEINSFFWRREFKSRPECWVCSLGCHCSQALRGQSKEIYVYTNLLTHANRYTHVYLYICLYILKTYLSSQLYVLLQSQHHKVHTNLFFSFFSQPFLICNFFPNGEKPGFIICNTVYQFICSVL